MDGVGFGSDKGILRISQANLHDDDYPLIAQQILEFLGEYYTNLLSNSHVFDAKLSDTNIIHK